MKEQPPLDPGAHRAARAVFERMRGRLPDGEDDERAVAVLATLITDESGIADLASALDALRSFLPSAAGTAEQQIPVKAADEAIRRHREGSRETTQAS